MLLHRKMEKGVVWHPFFIPFSKRWPKGGQNWGIKEKRFCIFAHFELLAKSLWCPEQDLNLHSFRNTHLKRARLPIPPPGHLVEFPLLELGGKKKQPTLLLFCAQDKTWTCTALRRLPPQSSVSTNSTTWANGVAFSVESGCKSTNFFRHSKIKIHLFWTKIPNMLKYKADNTPIFLRQKADCEGKIGKIKSYFEKNGGCFWLVFSFFWSSKKWREFLFIKN